MKIQMLFLLACAAGVTTGCQMGRQPTAGEEIVQAAQDAPAPAATAPTTAKTQPVATALVTPIVKAPATTSATTTASTRPTGHEVYVSADADEATRLRNWKPVTNFYPSGRVVAGPVYRIIVPPPRSSATDDVVVSDLFQTVMTVPQMVATPIWAFFTPPMTPVEYHGETNPPSYTLDEPLPYYQDEKVRGLVQMKR